MIEAVLIGLVAGVVAGLLGVQRTTVNAIARQLQGEGLITSRRGSVTTTPAGIASARRYLAGT
mgnify:CR=1 FL=1